MRSISPGTPNARWPISTPPASRCWKARLSYTASDVPFFATKEGRSFGYSCAINGAVARVTGVEPQATGKPSAHALAFVADQLGIAKEDVGVVGDDATAEMQMAREGGAIGIAVTSGSTSADEWAQQPEHKTPDIVLASIGELVERLGLR